MELATERFEPYCEWLGIPPEEQPVDHYKLIGVSRFESRRSIIEAAYDQRMIYLRSKQTGPRSSVAERLKNELTQAFGVLLDPAKRAAYDASLVGTSASNSEKPAFAGIAVTTGSPAGKPAVIRKASNNNHLLIQGVAVIFGGLAAIPMALFCLYFVFQIDPLGIFAPTPKTSAAAAASGRPRDAKATRPIAVTTPVSSDNNRIIVSGNKPEGSATTSQASAPESGSNGTVASVPPLAVAPAPASVQPAVPEIPKPVTLSARAAVQTEPTDRLLWVHANGYAYEYLGKGSWQDRSGKNRYMLREISRSSEMIELEVTLNTDRVRIYADHIDLGKAPYQRFFRIYQGAWAPPINSIDESDRQEIEKHIANYQAIMDREKASLVAKCNGKLAGVQSRPGKVTAKNAMKAAIESQRNRFELNGLIPLAAPLRPLSADYLKIINRARSDLALRFDRFIKASELAGSPHGSTWRAWKYKLLQPDIVVRLDAQDISSPHTFTYWLLADGTVNAPDSGMSWVADADAITVLNIPVGRDRLSDRYSFDELGTTFEMLNSKGGKAKGKVADQAD